MYKERVKYMFKRKTLAIGSPPCTSNLGAAVMTAELVGECDGMWRVEGPITCKKATYSPTHGCKVNRKNCIILLERI